MHSSRTLLPVLLICGSAVAANSIAQGEPELLSAASYGSFLDTVVQVLMEAKIVSKQDLDLLYSHSIRDRQGRDSALSEFALDILKEVLAEFITATLGDYLGVASSRSSATDAAAAAADPFDLVAMVVNAVRKNSIQKRMGCPT